MKKIINGLEECKEILQREGESEFEELKPRHKKEIFDIIRSISKKEDTDGDIDYISATFTILNTKDDVELDISFLGFGDSEDVDCVKQTVYKGYFNYTNTISIANIDNHIAEIKKHYKREVIGILNTSILTTTGQYKLDDIALKDAQDLIKNKDIDSAVGHESTSQVLTTLLDQDIPVNRQNFTQQVGQQCIVFKLLGRPDEDKILSLDDIQRIGYKFQLLTRIK